MRNILKVFKRDVKSTVKNPIALLIVVALCILPSLYAWVNILACWDPYNHTSTIPVAVVNEDEGTELLGEKINIGEEVQTSLQNNKSIGWEFVSLKKGDMGLVDGKYYAMIVIPKDFSSCITSISTDKEVKPQILYKVNTKATPVAGKITEVAQTKIVEEITSNFISTVNKTVFEKLNKVGVDLEKNKTQIIELRKGIIYANKHLDEITNALDNGNMGAQALNGYLTELKTVLPQMNEGITKLEGLNTRNIEMISQVQSTLNQSLDNIRVILEGVNVEAKKVHAQVQDINNSVANGITDGVTQSFMEIDRSIDSMINNIDGVIKYLEAMNGTGNNLEVSKLIKDLNVLKETLKSEKETLNNLEKKMLETNEVNRDMLNQLNDLSLKAVEQSTEALKQYDKVTRGSLDSIGNNLIRATKDANEILKTTEGLGEQINNLLALGTEGTEVVSSTTGDLSSRLKEFRGIIKLLGDALEKTNEDDVIQIISILQSKPELMGEYISSPVNLVEEPVYGIPNYGSAMTPIYSVLALWVGALMLISVLKVNPPKFQGDEGITIRQKYFGKLIFFSSLGFIQGLIVSLGNVALLKVYSVNPFLMIIMSCFIGVVFNIIVFTLMSVFGNIGKVVAIILMVIQLAGCGGSYPIQLDPLFFRILQPFFPFTYAVGGYREAIAGPLPSAVALDFVVLSIYGLLFILVGIFLKQRLHKTIKHFEESFEESKVGE